MEARVQVPEECSRTQNIVVMSDFVRSLKKALNWGKSEKLPDESYYPLYIGEDLLEQMNVADNQIIWGRRGTGKTHLLKAFTQMINEEQNEYKLAYYISCDNIKMETPVNMTFNDDMQRMKYFARETFKAFLINVVEQIIDSYQSRITGKYRYIDKDEQQRKDIQKKTDDCLTRLLEISTTGVPRIIETSEKKSINVSYQKTSEKGGGIEGEVSIPNLIGSIKGFFSRNKRSKGEDLETSEIEQKIEYNFSFLEIQKEIRKLVEALQIDMLYICIDELWLIDDKNNISFQPMFLDYLRRTFFKQRGVSIKIASIRETAKLNNKTAATTYYGLQSGHDIVELANLDTIQDTEEVMVEKFSEILTMRLNYFSEKYDKEIFYKTEYILETIFKNERYFKKMVAMANGIPRNFLRILQLCLVKINYDLEHYFVHMYLISEIVMAIYVSERRSNMPMNDNSVFNIINEYIESSRNAFFIVSNEQVKEFSVEINNLIYTEIVHRIPSSVTPNKIMDKYKAYYVDAGKYLYLLKEVDIEGYLATLSNFSLVIPNDIMDNKDKYIVDLEKASVDYLECPNCGAIVGKGNPVYKKYNCCNVCSFEFGK